MLVASLLYLYFLLSVFTWYYFFGQLLSIIKSISFSNTAGIVLMGYACLCLH